MSQFVLQKKEYETLKSKSKAYGIEQLSLYVRKKALTDNDEYLFNVSKIRGIYDHLAQLEMEFETIKNEAGLSEYDILGYEREFADIEEELKKIKSSHLLARSATAAKQPLFFLKNKGVAVY